MRTSTKVVIITLVSAVLAFLSNAVGPRGVFWRPAADAPDPAGIQRLLFAILLAIEALALGLAVSFLLYGFPLVQAVSTASPGLTLLSFLLVGWRTSSFPRGAWERGKIMTYAPTPSGLSPTLSCMPASRIGPRWSRDSK